MSQLNSEQDDPPRWWSAKPLILPLRPLRTRALGNGRMAAVDLDRDGALARACKLSGSRLRLNADIRLSKPPMACTLTKLTLRSWSTYGSTIWRESRDQQRLPPDV